MDFFSAFNVSKFFSTINHVVVCVFVFQKCLALLTLSYIKILV